MGSRAGKESETPLACFLTKNDEPRITRIYSTFLLPHRHTISSPPLSFLFSSLIYKPILPPLFIFSSNTSSTPFFLSLSLSIISLWWVLNGQDGKRRRVGASGDGGRHRRGGASATPQARYRFTQISPPAYTFLLGCQTAALKIKA